MNDVPLRRAGIALAIAAVLALAASVATGQASSLPAHPVAAAALPRSLLTQAIPDSTANAAQLQRGQYLVVAGDCISCHARPGGEALAGGLGLNTPFGTIYSSNITPDKQTGIGDWNADQFYRAMHDGIGAHGENLYPAFPYPWFRRVSREDVDAIFAFLQSTPPVHYEPPANQLPFPLNIRFMVKGWNLLFLKSDEFQSDPQQSVEWNRGAYLVEGLGHCAACHTPKNSLGAAKSDQALQGGRLDNWVAPDLTGNPRTGLGSWSAQDVTEFLHSGRNAHAAAGGSMAEVIEYSTSLLSDADIHSIATYLKSRAPGPSAAAVAPDAGAMRRGGAIYADVCAACHLQNGAGQPRLFPPLVNDATLQQRDPTGLLHLLLAGTHVGASDAAPTPLAMPSYAWKLDDAQIADLATYIRNSWGNQAAPVATADSAKLRRQLGLEQPRGTQNSGDWK